MNFSGGLGSIAIIVPIVILGCASVIPPEPVLPPPVVVTAPVPIETPVLQEPPALEDIIFLPQPRIIHFEENVYAPDFLVPVEVIDREIIPHVQGYLLSITPEKICITGYDESGIFYARQTLEQLKRQFAGTRKLPVVQIEDWPDFPNRGVMLDIARDKVPTLETLFGYVDLFASLKYNQLQLYMEHTFAYPGHETVWKDASPMTAEEIQRLDAYCRERYIELVPNQNSFGHMHRWLQHDAYTDLGETPTSSDLCPTNPRSIALLNTMYDSLLPNFSSKQFNVGCDETFSMGKGGSKKEVKRIGKGRVYLNFLKQIYGLVQEHGKTMQFWGDIILKHPELVPELPDHIIAMEWGYEANHPFAKRGSKFAKSGIPFYVCPGTSSWNSLLGRTDNAIENLRLAAGNGIENGAIGYLVTDWGDNGHWQFAPISFVPFAWGAAVSWAYDANSNIDLARAADTHIFLDRAGVMSRAAMDLGSAHARTGMTRGNATVYYGLLIHALQSNPNRGYLKGMTLEGLHDCRIHLEEALKRMKNARMERKDGALILAEFSMNTRMALFAVRLGEERLRAGGVSTSKLPATIRISLVKELNQIMDAYSKLWLARNRPGGLTDSIGRLEKIIELLTA
ncbi:MAG: family 20 glycosylhydrolase [Candidatus Hydrogenedentes bacterium]|nr:family 20 glycosylhydrolase [Candidatus Hydrogenedentota bacterium]